MVTVNSDPCDTGDLTSSAPSQRAQAHPAQLRGPGLHHHAAIQVRRSSADSVNSIFLQGQSDGLPRSPSPHISLAQSHGLASSERVYCQRVQCDGEAEIH